MPKHAYLSASASHRWLSCPPSAKLCAQEEDKGSPYKSTEIKKKNTETLNEKLQVLLSPGVQE